MRRMPIERLPTGQLARSASAARISLGSMKRTSSSTVRTSEMSSVPRSRKKSTSCSTSSSGALAPEVIPRVSTPSSHSSSHLQRVVDQVRVRAALAGHLDQPVRVRGVRRADHQHQIALLRERLHRDLPVGSRVTDVVGLRPDDVRELLLEPLDDSRGLVEREGRLGDVRDVVGILELELVDLLGGFDEDDVVRGLAGRPLDLLVALVADEDDRVALLGELARLDVDLGDQRASGVDRAQLARLRAFSCTLGATPCAEKTTTSPSGTSVSSSTKIAPRLASSLTTCLLWTISLRT